MDPTDAEEKLHQLVPAAALLAERTLESREHDGQRHLLVVEPQSASVFFPTGLQALPEKEFRDLIRVLEALHAGEKDF
jgi:hypothetical protein